jgi:hypothetical protein
MARIVEKYSVLSFLGHISFVDQKPEKNWVSSIFAIRENIKASVNANNKLWLVFDERSCQKLRLIRYRRLKQDRFSNQDYCQQENTDSFGKFRHIVRQNKLSKNQKQQSMSMNHSSFMNLKFN